MSLRNLAHLYRVRLRTRIVGEGFALVGIAAGVALLFASQVASESLTGSLAQLSKGVVGNASLQLTARSPEGMSEGVLEEVRAINGVEVAAPLVEASAEAGGPKGSKSVELIGADGSLRKLGGELTRKTELEPFAGIGAVLLPGGLAREVGVTRFGKEVTLELYGRRESAPLYEVLTKKKIGGLSESPVVVAPLFYAQELAGLPGRLSRILVRPAAGAQDTVRSSLQSIAARHGLNVESTTYDEELFAKAASASNQSTTLFAVISALVGFLFAFNATLLTVGQRKKLIVDLRREGYEPKTVITVLAVDGLVLGIGACVVGLILGHELSVHLFTENPGYLGSAFALGTQRVVGVQAYLIAVAGGMLAALVAVLSPVRAVRSRDPLAAAATKEGAASSRRPALAAAAGAACLVAATVVLLVAPKLAIGGMLLLVGALLLLLGSALSAAVRALAITARRITGVVGHVAAMELTAARSRTLGVAATGAVAVFGAVAIQGAHGDLLKGLENAARDENAYTDVWVAPGGAYNLLRTAPFEARGLRPKLEHLPAVRTVSVYRGGLLDWGTRRVWVIAPPAEAKPLLPASQIVEGNVSTAERRVGEGGWVVVSKALAEEHHLKVGGEVRIPSPNPTTMRVAAESTNIGWAPGAMSMNAADYARAWGSEEASAYLVELGKGESQELGTEQIRGALGPGSGLSVQTAKEHEAEQNALSKQGLDRLTQIAVLILAVAVLAMGAAIGSMVWQRRGRLAKLKLEGFARRVLWRTIIVEAALLVGVGCTAGAVVGIYGQQLLDRALANVINFPVVYTVSIVPALVSLGIVAGAALAIVAVPGYIATGVSPAVAVED